MKLAIYRGGIWFATSILISFFLIGGRFEDESTQTIFITFVAIGLLFGLLAFCATQYDQIKEERELQLEDRRKAIKASGSGIE